MRTCISRAPAAPQRLREVVPRMMESSTTTIVSQHIATSARDDYCFSPCLEIGGYDDAGCVTGRQAPLEVRPALRGVVRSVTGAAHAENVGLGSVIDRSLIEDMFERMREGAKWDIDGECLWGYFFTDTDPEELRAAGRALKERGYRYVGLLWPSEEGEDEATIFLHVEKVETHTVDSLCARNEELERFAVEFGLATYDGMDVGARDWSPTNACNGRGQSVISRDDVEDRGASGGRGRDEPRR